MGSRVAGGAAAAKLGAGQEWETVNCFPFFKTGNLSSSVSILKQAIFKIGKALNKA